MRLLLTNDDGIMAPGLRALWSRLRKEHDVRVVAPETERSAAGHAITLADPLRVKPFRGPRGMTGHAVNGTPADCVKIAVRSLLDEPPDLVISGINAGANVGTNVLYSGTVSASTEAALLGLPSMAVSVKGKPRDYGPAAAVAEKVALAVAEKGLPPGVSLNVNVPNLPLAEIRGIRTTRMGSYRVVEYFDRRLDPGGRVYFWQTVQTTAADSGLDEDVDDGALRAGYVSVTPLFPDLTAHDFLPTLAGWGLEL